MTESFRLLDDQQLNDELPTMSLNPEVVKQSEGEGEEVNCEIHHGTCAICLNKIVLQETALVKGCEHAYCVTCILRWATYKEKPTCPQCKHPFESLSIHRDLDGSIHDYMLEESVCLLVRASWFKPLIVEEATDDVEDDYYHYRDDEEHDDLDEVYYNNRSSSNLRIGNRRWGDNGFVRAGRQEARPPPRVYLPKEDAGAAGSSRQTKSREGAGKEPMGRRAKRTMKREAANRAAHEKGSG